MAEEATGERKMDSEADGDRGREREDEPGLARGERGSSVGGTGEGDGRL